MSEYKKVATIKGTNYFYNGKEFAKEMGYQYLVEIQDKKVLSELEKTINKEV